MTRKANRAAPAKERPDQEVSRLDGPHTEYSASPEACARLTLRTVANEDGQFVCLERADG